VGIGELKRPACPVRSKMAIDIDGTVRHVLDGHLRGKVVLLGGTRWRIGWLKSATGSNCGESGVGVAAATFIEEFLRRQ